MMNTSWQLDQGGEAVYGSSNKTGPRISVDLHQQLPRAMQGVVEFPFWKEI